LRQHDTRYSAEDHLSTDVHEESGSSSRGGASNSRHRTTSGNQQQDQRKVRQFCRQVQRALNLALTECSSGASTVEEVVPAPDCGRLLVYVGVPLEADVPSAMAELRQLSPRLREEVARAISRKRAPELTFVPLFFEEGSMDE